MGLQLIEVDPRELHVPPSCVSGADPFELQRQIARFGASTIGMPPPWVYRGADGALMIYNGVTRATRIAKLAPGVLILVDVIRTLPHPLGPFAEDRELSPMISPVREEILTLLVRLSELTPDVRFGQLIANLSYQAVAPTVESVWEMEDEQLLDAIRKHIDDRSVLSAEVVGSGDRADAVR